MSRRSGQSGYIERKGNAYYVRFWIDVPGQEKRAHKSVRICPVSGLGRLSKPEREREAREIIRRSGADTGELFNEILGLNLGITFRQQAEWWLSHIQTRKRKPVKPKTATSWKECLDKWLNPNLGEMPLSSVNNLTVKELVSKMVGAGLAPKSIHNYIQVVKMVLASAVDEQGDEIYPRKWNHEFIDLPEVKDQKTPSFTSEELSTTVASSDGQYRILYILLGATGLRIGEALGLEIKHLCDGCSTIKVRQSVWNGCVQLPKTSNAIRDIDVHPDVAAMFRKFIGGRTAGFLFQTLAGRSISQSDILTRDLHPILESAGLEKRGFHAFRRFRTTWLRKKRVPEDLLRFWIGHADRSVTDGYSKVKEDVGFRKKWVKRVGLGFELLPSIRTENLEVVPICTQDVLEESVV